MNKDTTNHPHSRVEFLTVVLLWNLHTSHLSHIWNIKIFFVREVTMQKTRKSKKLHFTGAFSNFYSYVCFLLMVERQVSSTSEYPGEQQTIFLVWLWNVWRNVKKWTFGYIYHILLYRIIFHSILNHSNN